MHDEIIGHFRVIKQIGAGGMAKVYLAEHKDVHNLRVVLKVLSDPNLAERFKQEADKLALLDGHPNICQIKGFFNHGDDFVITMEYVEGVTIDEQMRPDKKYSAEEAIDVAVSVLKTLESAHDKGISHRDIKPSNLMVDSKNNRIKIIDFGLARGESDPHLTRAGAACGTPTYMAPEQFTPSEETDYKLVDLYATGSSLFYMLTHSLPFEGDNDYVIRDAKLFSEPTKPRSINSSIPAELEKVILKSLEKEPSKRYQTAREMWMALENAKDSISQPESTRIIQVKGLENGGGKRRRLPAKPLILAAATLAIVFLAWVFWPSFEPSQPGLIAPVLIEPPSGDTLEVTETRDTIAFMWKQSQRSDVRYTFQISRKKDFSEATQVLRTTQPTVRIPAEDLASGRYFWRVQSADLERNVGDFSPPNTLELVVLVAATPTGTIAIRSNLQAIIRIDGDVFGENATTARAAVDTGTHRIRLENPQSTEGVINDQVRVGDGETVSRSYRFTLPTQPETVSSPTKTGTLVIGSNPLNAWIFIDNKPTHQQAPHTFEDVTAGQHRVSLIWKDDRAAADGENRKDTTATVIAGDRVVVKLTRPE